FGMGYAPIKMLTDLPLSIVKLPNRQTSSIKFQEHYHSVITHLTQLVHEIGLKVWMDQINNQDDFDQLNALKIDFMQGQYFRQLPT
ncbi:MAG: EAL domain-containing protein, partial [Pseudomonadota bacterium]